jgi:fumarate reductase (CoM/CoB) subunit B
MNMIEIKVLRYNPQKDEKPHFEGYKIQKKDKMKVLDALNYINEKYNANLAYRFSCRAGQCGSCALKVNGEVKLACKAEIKDGDIIEPLDFEVIKDLVVDRSEVEDKVKSMKLFLEGECEVGECPTVIDPKKYADSKKLRSCIECYSCLSACPVVKEASDFAGPYFMRYISKFALDPRDCGDRAREGFDEGLYSCTSCSKCVEVCPKEINTFGGAIEKLREIACREGVGPLPPHKHIKELIETTGRSVEPTGRGKYGEGFIKAVSKGETGKKPKIAVFTGCMVDYKLPEIAEALIKVLKKHGVNVDVPEGQVCCGSPMLRTGQTDVVEELVKKNYEALKDYDTIITVCAGCGSTLKNDYPRYGANLNVKDISEFLADRLNTKDMKPVNMKVTYHDPCHLARGQGIREEPRSILKRIKGVEFVEMEKPDQCCGAGGGVRAGKPEIAAGLGGKKAEMVRDLEVDAVVTICPFCEYNIKDCLESSGMKDVKVLNLLKLLEMAYDC